MRALAVAICVLLSGTAAGQFQSRLTTQFAGPTVFDGNMFDVSTTSDVTLCGVDVNLAAGTYDLEIYQVNVGDTWVGQEVTPSSWTLLASAIGVVSNGADNPTPFPTAFSLQLAAGTQTGLYVTVSSSSAQGQGMRYSNGALVGNVAASDGVVSILEGAAKGYPFTNTYPPRVWNGTLYYESGLHASCSLARPTAPEYETNDADASLTVDGQSDPGPFSPIQRSVAVGAPAGIDFASTGAGLPWDVIVVPSAPTASFSQLGIATTNDQTVNAQFTLPGVAWLNGGLVPNLTTTSFPASPFTISVIQSSPFEFSGQMVVISPTNPDGFALSHAIEVTAVPCAMSSGFENVALGAGQAPSGWENPPSGQTPWTVISGPTPSGGTGPSVGAAVGNNYIYCETSGGAGSATFTFDTCIISASSAPNQTLSFQLSRIGSAIGTLSVYMDDGTGTFSELLTSFTGAEPNGTDWTAETVSFTPTSALVRFRFEYVGAGGFSGDLALDEILVQ